MENNEAAEINDVAPSSLSHLIGQRGVIDQVRVALDAAMMDGRSLTTPCWLDRREWARVPWLP